MERALELGVSIPKQLASIGCGDLHYDGALRVPLSSVDQKNEKIGRRAAEIILKLSLHSKADPEGAAPVAVQRVVLKSELLIRQSTAR